MAVQAQISRLAHSLNLVTGDLQMTLQTGVIFLGKFRQIILNLVAVAAFFGGRPAEDGCRWITLYC